jgi:sensor histidine kinase YesM
LLLEHYKNEEAEQRRKNLLLGAGLLLAAVTILFLWVYQRTRLRNLRRELEMKLEALRAQMNPHFISNCLNAIDSLINHGKNQEASHYIIRFSRLCRMVLNNARHKVISLSEELDMLDYFVSLEKLRFGDDRLQYRVMVDPSLNKDEIAVPPMLLQPFVENAIWHGIQPKSGPGLVQVEVRRMDQTSYQCIIEDDGIGRQKSQEIKSRSVLKHNSLGMAITQERLQGFAGAGNAQLDIQDLQSGTGAPVGTRVIITLPILPL